jgi:lipoprotein-releasing system ATP-binding protein
MSDQPAIQLSNIERRYEQPDSTLEVLRGLSLSVRPGEAVALVGYSGSGKSTLLHIAGLLERPDGGDVILAGQKCGVLNDRSEPFCAVTTSASSISTII